MDGVSIPTNLILRFLTNQRDALGCIPVKRNALSQECLKPKYYCDYKTVLGCELMEEKRKKISFYKFLYLLRTFFLLSMIILIKKNCSGVVLLTLLTRRPKSSTSPK